MQLNKEKNDDNLRKQTVIDTFHYMRVAIALMRPIAPFGTDMVRDYMNFSEDFWDWKTIFEPIYHFMKNPESHKLKFLEPRIDFFKKHQSQVNY